MDLEHIVIGELVAFFIIALFIFLWVLREKKRDILLLNERIRSYEQNIESVQKLVSSKNDRINAIAKAHIDESNEFSELSDSLMDGAIVNVNLGIDSLGKNTAEQTKLLSELGYEVGKLGSESATDILSKMNTRLKRSEVIVKDLSVELENANKQVERFKDKSQVLYKRVSGLEDKEIKSSRMGKEILLIRKKLKKKEADLLNERAISSRLIDENRVLVTRSTEKYSHAEVEEIRGDLSRMTERYNTANDELQAHRSKSEGESELEFEAEVTRLNRELEIATSELHTYKEALSNSLDNSLQDKYDQRGREIDQLEDTIIKMDSKLSIYKSKIQTA